MGGGMCGNGHDVIPKASFMPYLGFYTVTLVFCVETRILLDYGYTVTQALDAMDAWLYTITVTPPESRVVIHKQAGEGYGDGEQVEGETGRQG